MSRVFIDTSAIYAVMVDRDMNHESARLTLDGLRDERAQLVTTSFVIQETVALLQHRVGMQAVRMFFSKIMPSLEIIYVDQDLLRQSVQALLAASRRQVSLTDWVSITAMREQRIARAFAFDKHFKDQDFEVC